MPIREVMSAGRVPVKAWTTDIEASAREQLANCAAMPFIHRHIAAMPDVHWGMGATVGSVIPTKKAIIPAAVGVDIGCGMMAAKLDINARSLPDNLSGVRSAIEAAVPHGRTDNGGAGDRGAWGDTPAGILRLWAQLDIEREIPDVIERHPKLMRGNVNTHRHLGTLGTGNHFVEVCLDEVGGVWLMLHSGSRGVGNRIGSYFIELAKKEMERFFVQLPDANLAYLPEGTQHFDDYWRAVAWAQDYARTNRMQMMRAAVNAVASALGRDLEVGPEAVNCHHNYVSRENHYGENVMVTRKGAIRARKGDLGIIPGSMGARSFIVEGLGNPESFHSCSHGAGRRMSRGQAKRTFTLQDMAEQTQGVECRKDDGVIDEIPGAYKDIDEVMENQSDLVRVVHTLRQVVCVKG